MSEGDLWVEHQPLARTPRKTDWSAVVAKVVARPGEFLLVDDSSSSGMAGYINREGLIAFREHPGFTFRAVTSRGDHTDGKVDLYLVANERED